MENIFIVILVLASIVGLTIIVERGLALRRSRVLPPFLISALANSKGKSDLAQVYSLARSHSSPLSRLLLFIEEHQEWDKQELAKALESRARFEIIGLERGMVVLEITVGIAPLLGLVGTIYGLITLFGSTGQTGLNDTSKLANGISIALNATLMGLLTAIPSLVAWSFYTKKVEAL
ncbi:MAG: tolQ, partial [Verrucomicrobiales bacterium]|nr:tolQ [Verrucomicrobiales bacterium]